MNNSPLILIIDDELAILKILQESLQDEDFVVKTTNDGGKALEMVGELIPDLVLLDIFMPGYNGLEMLSKIKKEYPQQKIIMISGFGNVSLAVEAVKNGALDFIEKPLNLDEVLSKISFLKLNEDLQVTGSDEPSGVCVDERVDALERVGIVGESFLFVELLTQINNVANLCYPLVIYGSPGVGKAVLVSYIHHISNFKKMSLAIINCATQPDLDLKGMDVSGILFLKHVDKLSSSGQKSLLNFLDSDYYKKMNAASKLRIIASSQDLLFKKVQEQRWSCQLFNRLNVTPIEIPSLAKRRHDIPLLISHFLDLANKALNKNISLCNLSIRYLRNKNWPGNVAELKNFISSLVNRASKKKAVIMLPEVQKFICKQELDIIEAQAFLNLTSFGDATASFQKRYLIHVIKKNNFDLAQAADSLKLSIDSLNNKIYELDINLKN